VPDAVLRVRGAGGHRLGPHHAPGACCRCLRFVHCDICAPCITILFAATLLRSFCILCVSVLLSRCVLPIFCDIMRTFDHIKRCDIVHAMPQNLLPLFGSLAASCCHCCPAAISATRSKQDPPRLPGWRAALACGAACHRLALADRRLKTKRGN
jgi:hypothetical protein